MTYILRTLSILQKKIMKNSTLRRQLPKLRPLNFLAAFLTELKYQMNL